MAEFSEIERINIAFKQVLGIQGLSNTDDSSGLAWFEETYSYSPFIVNNEVFVDEIPTASNKTAADANVASYPSIIQKVDIKLTPVTGTNGRAWAAFSTYGDANSGLLGDWILPFYWGRGYAMQLFQDGGVSAGQEITTTEGTWIASYKSGFIVLGAGFSAPDMGWTTPLWARVYRYIGSKGISGTTANVSLDNAYDIGNFIDADGNAVVINASSGVAPLQITPINYTPNVNVAAGQVFIRDGILYNYDSTRSKWLSVDQPNISYQVRNGDACYLSTGTQTDINSGFMAIRKGTIIGVTAKGGSGNQTKSFSIRKNGNMTDLYSFSLTAGSYIDAAVNLDFDASDNLQVFCSATGAPVFNPRVNLIIAWNII